MNKKNILIVVVVLVVIILASGFWFFLKPKAVQAPKNQETLPVSVAPNPDNSTGVYRNETYGFQMRFPESWKGYYAIKGNWQGRVIKEENSLAFGPMLTFRNPNWKEQDHWQDIPVMIFTDEAWKLVQNEEISLGAAPIGPSEIGRNGKYIFATPARWVGFTDAKGQDEAVEIVKTFKAF